MINGKLEELAWKQGQATDALCLLLDGLECEGRGITKGPAAAECFVERLRVYMGAFHLIEDTLEGIGKAVEELAGHGEGGEP